MSSAKFGLVMYGAHNVGRFNLEFWNISNVYYDLKNVYLSPGFVDPITHIAYDLQCLYVKDLGNNKVTLIKDLGRGQLFAHKLWVSATEIMIPSASFISQNSFKNIN